MGMRSGNGVRDSQAPFFDTTARICFAAAHFGVWAQSLKC